MLEDIMSITPGSEGWVGPKKLSGKHIEFVHAYLSLKGSERTYKNAALKMGIKESTAISSGSLYWSYTIVKQYYFECMQDVQNKLIESYLASIQNLEEIGSYSKDEGLRIEASHLILKTINEIQSDNILYRDKGKVSGVASTEVLDTFNRIALSTNKGVNNE